MNVKELGSDVKNEIIEFCLENVNSSFKLVYYDYDTKKDVVYVKFIGNTGEEFRLEDDFYILDCYEYGGEYTLEGYFFMENIL